MKKLILLLIVCVGLVSPLQTARSVENSEPVPGARTEFLKPIEKQIDAWEDKLTKFKEKAKKTESQIMQDLELQMKALRGEIMKAEEVSDEKWTEARAGIMAKKAELEKAMKKWRRSAH